MIITGIHGSKFQMARLHRMFSENSTNNPIIVDAQLQHIGNISVKFQGSGFKTEGVIDYTKKVPTYLCPTTHPLNITIL